MKLLKKIIIYIFAIVAWVVLMILPYGISKLIVDGIDKTIEKYGW